MSYVIFNTFVDMSAIGTPSGGYIVAYDLDGILKQKDVDGVITPIDNLGGVTPSLSDVLLSGNNTGTHSIVFASGSSLLSDFSSSGVKFYKDSYEHILLSSDIVTGQKAIIDISDEIEVKNTGNTSQIRFGVSNFFTESNYQDIAIIQNSVFSTSVNDLDRSSIYIGTRNSTFSYGVSNSVIIGGKNLIATQSDTVYLGNYVNINNSYTLPNTDGTDGQVLKTDGLGNVIWGEGSAGTPSLSDVLLVGNQTGNSDIQIENGYTLRPVTGDSFLDLESLVGKVKLSNGLDFLEINYNDIKIYATSSLTASATSGANINIGIYKDDILISDNMTFSATSSFLDKSAIFIGSKNSSFSAGISNSVIIGGENILATQSNTVYMPNMILQGNVLGKYTVQPDTQTGWDDLSIPTKKYVDDQLSSNFVTDNNSGIEINVGTTNSTINTTYNTLLDPTLAMPYSVGGIPLGTTAGALFGLNMVEMFNDLLFPTVNPTYTIPSLSIVSSVTGITEIGTTVIPIVTLIGTENDGGPYNQLVIYKNINSTGNIGILTASSTASMTVGTTTNIASQFGYADPNNPNLTYAIIGIDTPFQVPPPVSGGSSTVVYLGKGDYNAGIAKKNNKGVTHSATAAIRNTTLPQAASTGLSFTSNSQTITGYYPYFYGAEPTSQTASQIKSIIESGTGYTSVVADANGTLTMNFNASSEWPWFAIFYSYSTKTRWQDTTITVNNGDIGLVPTDLFSAPTILTINSPQGKWSVQYKIYVANKITDIGTGQIF